MSLNKWGKSPKTSFESKLEILAQLNSAAKEGDELTDEFIDGTICNQFQILEYREVMGKHSQSMRTTAANPEVFPQGREIP